MKSGRTIGRRAGALHSSQLLLIGAIAVVCGVAASLLVQDVSTRAMEVGVVLLFLGLANALFLPAKIRVLAVIVCAAGLAIVRVSLLPSYSNQYDTFQEFQGVVVREPEIRIDEQRLVVRSDAIDGLLQIKRPLQPRYNVGDVMHIRCTVRAPEPFDGFAYDMYLARYGIAALCRYPSIEVTGSETSWRTVLFGAKSWIQQRFQRSLAAPEHTLILGALFGDKRAVPPHIADAFRATGTSHLLVISGMHVSMITTILTAALSKLSLSRRQLTISILSLLALYVVLTGLQSSALRASLFGATALIAQLLGRPRSSLRLLVVIAAGMLLWQPLLLLYDAGFQLSFLATAGIIIFQKPVERGLGIIPEVLTMRSTMATSLAAMVTTTPLIAHSFETFSVVALLANTVVVPLMPMVMTGAIAATVLSIVSVQLTTWLALPLYYLLKLMVSIITWFALWPHAAVEVRSVGIVTMSIAYCFISYLAWRCLPKQ